MRRRAARVNIVRCTKPLYLRGHPMRNYVKVFASVDASGPKWFHPLFERMPPPVAGMMRRTQVLMLATGDFKCFWYYVHTVAPPPRLVGVCDCQGEAECGVCG
jgi:hypothetical protein